MLPYFKAFPLSAENFACKIFFGKNAQPCSKASPCLIVLAHNEAKIVSLVPRLPLASSCLRTMRQKLSALFQGFPSGGGSLRSKVVRGSFKFDIIFYNRKQATPLIRRRSATPSPRGEGYIIALFHAFPARGKVPSASEADEGRLHKQNA